MPKKIVVQGTAQGAGASFLRAGLAGILRRRRDAVATIDWPSAEGDDRAFLDITESAKDFAVIIVENSRGPVDLARERTPFPDPDARIILVADGSRDDVYAGISGTLALMPPQERALVAGIVVNRVPSDRESMRRGLARLADAVGIPILGAIPQFAQPSRQTDGADVPIPFLFPEPPVDVVALASPGATIPAGATALSRHSGFGVRLASTVEELGLPDLVFFPHCTEDSPAWESSGILSASAAMLRSGTPVVGSALRLANPLDQSRDDTVQSSSADDLYHGKTQALTGIFSCLSGVEFSSRGRPLKTPSNASPFASIRINGEVANEGMVWANVLLTGLQCVFAEQTVQSLLIEELLRRKGFGDREVAESMTFADTLQKYLDVSVICP